MKRKEMFFNGDRYFFDTKMCAIQKGYAQIDTTQDAPYFGTWANPKKLEIVTYAEGDVTILQAENEKEFTEQIIRMAEWNIENGFTFGIDDMDSNDMKTRFVRLGLEKYLY